MFRSYNNFTTVSTVVVVVIESLPPFKHAFRSSKLITEVEALEAGFSCGGT